MIRVVCALVGHGLEMVAANGKTWFRELDHPGEGKRKGLRMFRKGAREKVPYLPAGQL